MERGERTILHAEYSIEHGTKYNSPDLDYSSVSENANTWDFNTLLFSSMAVDIRLAIMKIINK